MAKAGDVGGSEEESDWLGRCAVSWEGRNWLVPQQQQSRVLKISRIRSFLLQISCKFMAMKRQLRRWLMAPLPAGSAGSSRTSSQSGCPLHEAPPYEATAMRKGEGQGEGKVGQSQTPTASVFFPSFIQIVRHPNAAWWAGSSSVTLNTSLSHTHKSTDLHKHTKMSQRFLSQLASSVLRVFGCSHDTVSVWMEDLQIDLVCLCVCWFV